ncbi:Rft-1-domain-containing protein [Schizopora paradoxa]|uniref:Man(5)GlcNAc(2)-PP-dolichol translocation protein RFT1 n=1 Tax=Schizopora paradoxa TaxID=27342 RepID=A0A0H2RQ18_9AGAM|nr:Rft-1-domain-containing protein [Schizopora paradoxa]
MPAKKTKQKPAVDTSLSLTYSLIGLQMLTKAVTFVLNQALVRLSTPQVYGTVSIQLELLLNTMLFLSREGFRNALLRVTGDSKEKGRSTLLSNIALLPVYAGVPVSISVSVFYTYFATGATRDQPYFSPTVTIYTVAAILELLCEPMFLRDVQVSNSRVRVKAEGIAVIIKAVVTTSILFLKSSELGLIAFAAGQLSCSFTLLSIYLLSYYQSTPFIIRKSSSEQQNSKSDKNSSYFDESLLRVSLAMTGQSFVKHILTEGDKVIMSRFSTLKDQGGYAVANNYGSLAARIFFQPIEESSRIFFSKVLSGPNITSAIDTAHQRLSSILSLYLHMSMVLVAFAQPYLPVVFAVLLPPKYLNTSAPAVLMAMMWYIPVMAINGILEAFVSSASTPKDVANQSKWMTYTSIGYVTCTAAAFKSGLLVNEQILVYLNMMNLMVRIVYASRFLREFQSRNSYPFRPFITLPPPPVMIVAGLTAFVSMLSYDHLEIEKYLTLPKSELLMNKTVWAHFGTGIMGLAVFFITWCVFIRCVRVCHLRNTIVILPNEKR